MMATLQRLVGLLAGGALVFVVGCGSDDTDVGTEAPSEEGCAQLFSVLRESAMSETTEASGDLVAVVAELLKMDISAVRSALIEGDPVVVAEIGELCREASELAEQNQSGEQTLVYVAAQPISAGTDALVAQMSGAIEARELSSERVDDDAVSDPAVLVGQKLRRDLPVGRVVLISDLTR